MTVEITADQYQSIPSGTGPPALVQGEPLADEVRYVTFVAAVDRQNAFGAKDVGGELLKEQLKRFGSKGLLALE